MKRFAVVLMATALVLMGATALLAADLPQALRGVDLASAQPLTNAQAQEIRGAAQPTTFPPGFGGTVPNPLFQAEEVNEVHGQAIFNSRVFIYVQAHEPF